MPTLSSRFESDKRAPIVELIGAFAAAITLFAIVIFQLVYRAARRHTKLSRLRYRASFQGAQILSKKHNDLKKKLIVSGLEQVEYSSFFAPSQCHRELPPSEKLRKTANRMLKALKSSGFQEEGNQSMATILFQLGLIISRKHHSSRDSRVDQEAASHFLNVYEHCRCGDSDSVSENDLKDMLDYFDSVVLPATEQMLS